jgi:hypothetical protein
MAVEIIIKENGIFVHKMVRSDPYRALLSLIRFMKLKYGID